MDYFLGKSLNYKENEVVSAESALKKKLLLLLYFTAFESEACRSFDEKLQHVYQEAVKRKLDLGVIVVPSDSTKDSYNRNVKSNYLDWYSVPYDDELLHILTYSFGVTHVPTLIVLEKNGLIVSREGIRDVESCGINVLVTWLN